MELYEDGQQGAAMKGMSRPIRRGLPAHVGGVLRGVPQAPDLHKRHVGSVGVVGPSRQFSASLRTFCGLRQMSLEPHSSAGGDAHTVRLGASRAHDDKCPSAQNAVLQASRSSLLSKGNLTAAGAELPSDRSRRAGRRPAPANGDPPRVTVFTPSSCGEGGRTVGSLSYTGSQSTEGTRHELPQQDLRGLRQRKH